MNKLIFSTIFVFLGALFLCGHAQGQNQNREPQNSNTTPAQPTPKPYSPKGLETTQSSESPKETNTQPGKKKKEPAPGKVIIDFQEGDIKQLIKVFSEILGKNFTYDDTIRGHVTLIGPKEVTKWQAKKVFESALKMMNHTVIWGWPINKIVPTSRAKTQGNVKVVY